MIKYLKESFVELNNVTWPTRQRGIKVTTIVFIFMLVSAAVLGVVDYVFSLGLESLINSDQNSFIPSDITPNVTPTDITTTPIESAPVEIAPADPSATVITPADPNVTSVGAEAPITESPQEGSPQVSPSETNPS